MGQFAYDFSLMLLHSLWQAALLLLLYKANMFFIKRQQPYYRRNLLFFILVIQLCLSVVTYVIYANDVQSLQPGILQVSAFIAEGSILSNLVPFLFTSYLLIIIYKISLLFYHWSRFKSNCGKSLMKASIDHRLFAIDKANELGIKRKVTLWYSNVISSPVTFGFFKPVILLPVAFLNQLSVKEAEMLILHELTHIKNNDYLLNFILIVSETIFFFNPFIKNICGLVKLEREKNCDLKVVQSAYSSVTYAEALLKIARFKSDVNRLHLAAASDNKQLLNRVLFFTSENNLRFSKNNYTSISFLFVALIFMLNLFTIKQLNRTPGYAGYEYTASTIPGYNAYSLTSSFDDTDDLPVVDKIEKNQHEVIAQSQKLYRNNHIYHPEVQEYVAVNPSEEEEVVDINESQFMPVTSIDVIPAETREFIFNEENSAGNKVTKAYKMTLVDGKWIAHPLWMYTESKLRPDSLVATKDSLPRAFHIVQ